MSRHFSVHPNVYTDIAGIVRFIQRDNPTKAQEVKDTLWARFEFLAQSPFPLGSEYPVKIPKLTGIRKFVVPEYRRKYLIFYRELPESTEVRILYVFHGMRDLPERMEDDLRE